MIAVEIFLSPVRIRRPIDENFSLEIKETEPHHQG
jgi:hypothetical protein